MDPNPNDPTSYQDVIPPAGPPPGTYPPPGSYPPPAASSSGLTENQAAMIAYITIIPAIVFLVMEPYNKSVFVRFHAFQCISFAVVLFAAHLVLAFIPIIGWLISILLSLAALVLWVICLMKASKGEWYKLPVIGDFAMGQAKSV